MLEFSIIVKQSKKVKDVLDDKGNVKERKEFTEVRYFLHHDGLNDIEFLPFTRSYKDGSKYSNKEIIKQFATIVNCDE